MPDTPSVKPRHIQAFVDRFHMESEYFFVVIRCRAYGNLIQFQVSRKTQWHLNHFLTSQASLENVFSNYQKQNRQFNCFLQNLMTMVIGLHKCLPGSKYPCRSHLKIIYFDRLLIRVITRRRKALKIPNRQIPSFQTATNAPHLW